MLHFNICEDGDGVDVGILHVIFSEGFLIDLGVKCYHCCIFNIFVLNMKFILVVDLDGSDLGAIGPISNDQKGSRGDRMDKRFSREHVVDRRGYHEFN